MRVLRVLRLLPLAMAEALAQTTPAVDGSADSFVAPVLKYTVVNGQGALMLGGRGAWRLNPTVMLGIGAYASMTPVDAPRAAVPFAPGELDLKLETFGAEFNYAPLRVASPRVTWQLFLGGGAAHYVQDTSRDQFGETDFMFVAEPAVGAEYALARSVALHVGASFRFVSGVEQPKLDNGDFSGPTVVLALTFGRVSARSARF